MSWSATYESKAKFRADEPLHADPISTTEVSEQKKLARELAESIIASGALGDSDGDFYVSLSGHANPHHRPITGVANDCVTVSVSQR